MAKAATYKIYTGSAWEELTFTPSSHTHSQYLTSSSLSGYATETWVKNQGYKTTDNNTTYSAGTGLSLSGTSFSVSYGSTAGTACQGNDSRLSDSRNAKDVYSWAKASTKPSYSWSEITSKPTTFTPESHTHDYLPLSGGTLTSLLTLTHDKAQLQFRGGHNSYDAVVSYQTSGNEAMVFSTKNAVTSFMFVNGEDTITNVSSTRWTSLTPGLQIKNNCVSISKLITNGTTPTYNLDVGGTANATTLYENGKALSEKYQAKGNYLTSHSYRPIQINSVSILPSSTSTALNLISGDNVSISNSGGNITISASGGGGGGSSELVTDISSYINDNCVYYGGDLSKGETGNDNCWIMDQSGPFPVTFKAGDKIKIYLDAGNSYASQQIGIVTIELSKVYGDSWRIMGRGSFITLRGTYSYQSLIIDFVADSDNGELLSIVATVHALDNTASAARSSVYVRKIELITY